MARHAAVQGRWSSLRLSVGGLVRAGAAGFAVVAAAVLVFSSWDERYVLGRPDEQAVVTEVVAVGPIGQGRSRCPGIEARLGVAEPRPGLPPQARIRGCEGDYRPGQEVLVRRVAGHPDRTYEGALGLAGLLGLSLAAGGVAAVLTSVGSVVDALWSERTWPRRRRTGRRR